MGILAEAVPPFKLVQPLNLSSRLQPLSIPCVRSTRARGDQAPPEHVTVCVHNFPSLGGLWVAESGDGKEITSTSPEYTV